MRTTKVTIETVVTFSGDLSPEQIDENITALYPGAVVRGVEHIYNAAQQAADFARDGQKIDAIKTLRHHYDLGLKEAKDIVEAFS